MPRAPRRCPARDCTQLIRPPARYCPDHTIAWAGERTRSGQVTSTAAWQRLRVQILNRDRHTCQINGPACKVHADQVDHIINIAAGGAQLDPANLQAACSACNARKAHAEAAKARTQRRNR